MAPSTGDVYPHVLRHVFVSPKYNFHLKITMRQEKEVLCREL
jgi:hypothetical protein